MPGFINPVQPGMGAKPDPIKPDRRPLGTRGGNSPGNTGRGGATVGMGNWAGAAPDPGKGGGKNTPTTGGEVDTPTPTAPPTGGSESGAGILENWFGQRASGTDPAYEYSMKRGMDSIDNRMAAGGSFNSGARGMQLSDFAANMGAQRVGQLDQLATGASAEHRGRLNDMFAQMMGLAGGQSGINSAYDLAAGGAMSQALAAALGFGTNKAGVDSQSQQTGLNNIFKLLGLVV